MVKNKSHKFLSLLSFDCRHLNLLKLGLASLDQLIGSDLILILHFLLLVVRNINNFIVQLEEI